VVWEAGQSNFVVKQARAALMVTQHTGISYGGMGRRPEQLVW